VTEMDYDTFNWVQARFECSLGELFENLKTEVKADVAERERLLRTTERKDCAFKFSASECAFSAWIDGNNIHQSVEFTLEERWISVRKNGGGDLICCIFATLNNQGRCVARIDHRLYERWQVRKLALEELFFRVV
jgi:hypothetical protein